MIAFVARVVRYYITTTGIFIFICAMTATFGIPDHSIYELSDIKREIGFIAERLDLRSPLSSFRRLSHDEPNIAMKYQERDFPFIERILAQVASRRGR